MKKSTWLFSGVVIIALATAMVTLGVTRKEQPNAPPAAAAVANSLSVRTIKPQVAPTAAELRLPAVAEPSADVRLFARVNGFILERRVDIGDRVKAGQVLAIISAPELEREHERARAALAQADARLKLEARNLERTRALVAQSFLSQSSLDERQAQLRMARADRNAAAAEVKRLAELLGFRTIEAPFAGVVTERNAERGDLITGNQRQADTHLFRVSNLDELRVAVEVPQSALGAIGVGGKVSIVFPELKEDRFAGVVARTAGTIDPRSGTMRVEVRLPNPDGKIAGGMAGHMIIAQGSGTPALLLPVNTVVQRDGVPHVALVAGTSVRFVPVQVGRNFGPSVEVLSGVGAADSVIVNPNALLREGDAVTAVAQSDRK